MKKIMTLETFYTSCLALAAAGTIIGGAWYGEMVANKQLNNLYNGGQQFQWPHQTHNNPALLHHSCDWPWHNPFTEAAIAGMPESNDPFYKNVPEAMVQTRWVLNWISTGITPRTNLVHNAIPMLAAATDRGFEIDTPFPVFGHNTVGVWNKGKVSVGAWHGQGANHDPRRRVPCAFRRLGDAPRPLRALGCHARRHGCECPNQFVLGALDRRV